MIPGQHLYKTRLMLALLMGLMAPLSVKSTATSPQAAAHAGDRDKLWHLVHGACAPAAAHGTYPPAPCAEVVAPGEPAQGYAVLKDRAGRYQYLVLPLARITGIESPALLAPDAPNYFADAWAARLYVEAALHRTLPRDALGMVVNSIDGRSQDQLHIHVDCLRPEVRDTLRRLLPTITTQWHALGTPLSHRRQRYQAMWVSGEELSANPFKMLAASLPAGDRMALHSLAVVGAYSPSGAPGFILLSGHVDRADGDHGNGDDLQDLDCAIATHAAP